MKQSIGEETSKIEAETKVLDSERCTIKDLVT